MQVLEQVMEEIDVERKKQREVCKDMIDTPGYRLYEKTVSIIKGIIRSHMNDGEGTDVPNNNGWIPCSERLPNKEEEYERLIITDVHGNVYANVIYGYAEDDDKEPCFHEWDDEYWQCRKYDTIAWQPLPEPYKPEDETKRAKNTQQEMEDFWNDK